MTTALLNASGKTPSKRQRLMRLVRGMINASTQDFNSLVGIASRLQEESVEDSINLRISSVLADEKEHIVGGLTGGRQLSGLARLTGMELQSLVILLLKNFRRVSKGRCGIRICSDYVLLALN